MRNSAIIKSRYWLGGTGEEILNGCSDLAGLLSFYLMTNPHAHMSGLYSIRLEMIAMDMHRPLETIKEALTELEEVNFCKYDHKARVVWVINMATHQVQFGNPKRVNGVLQQLNALPQTDLIFGFKQYYSIEQEIAKELPKDCQTDGKRLRPIPSLPDPSASVGALEYPEPAEPDFAEVAK